MTRSLGSITEWVNSSLCVNSGVGKFQRGPIPVCCNYRLVYAGLDQLHGGQFRGGPIPEWVNYDVDHSRRMSIPEQINYISANSGVAQLQSGQFRNGPFPERVNSGVYYRALNSTACFNDRVW